MVAYVEGPGGHRVELNEYFSPADRGKVESRPCDNGFAHLAYDVDAAVAVSEAYGFLPLGTPVGIDLRVLTPAHMWCICATRAA
jgi:hypothetical protein